MTIRELIERLELIDSDKKDLPVYVFDYTQGRNFEIKGISLFDEDDEHSIENMLSININNEWG